MPCSAERRSRRFAAYNQLWKIQRRRYIMVSTNANPGNGNHSQDKNRHGDNGHSVPRPRAEWIAQRKAENRDGNFSQMHYARKGLITEEMTLSLIHI